MFTKAKEHKDQKNVYTDRFFNLTKICQDLLNS